MKATLIALLLITYSTLLFSQTAPPDTDIFIFKIDEVGSNISISDGKNITKRKGYDNQPSFIDNDHLIYSAYIDGQNDIMMIDLKTNEISNITNTEESEYSPLLIPGTNWFATVRVEKDDTQRLWKFQKDGNGTPEVAFKDIAPVGYFAWNDKSALMFVLGRPATLVFANADGSNKKTITNNIGRTIKLIPGTQDFTYERREENGDVSIYQLNSAQQKAKVVIKKPSGASDWGITKNGTYITSVKSKLMKFNPKFDKGWVLLTDLKQTATGDITRMGISSDNKHLALVINQ